MAKTSNPRDLLLALLGDVLYVERRLAGGVLRELERAAVDESLRSALREHLEETRVHVERAEVAFRRLAAAPSANLSASFEAAVAQHDELAASIVLPALADVFHAHAAIHTEHYEIAGYTTILAFADAVDASEAVADLRATLDEEERARETLVRLLPALARGAG